MSLSDAWSSTVHRTETKWRRLINRQINRTCLVLFLSLLALVVVLHKTLGVVAIHRQRRRPGSGRDGEREVERESENIITLLSEVIRTGNNCWSNISLPHPQPHPLAMISAPRVWNLVTASCRSLASSPDQCTSGNRVDCVFQTIIPSNSQENPVLLILNKSSQISGYQGWNLLLSKN